MQFGLLGRKLGHSYSPMIHKHLGDYPYHLFEKKPEELADFLQKGAFDGLNITNPYKKAVMEHCAELSPIAKQLGAVNTIVRRADGKLVGHNTDYFGFKYLLESTGIAVNGKDVIVLGAGGASMAVTAVLQEMHAVVHVITHKENCPETLKRYPQTTLLVNATPEGMYPNNGNSPADLRLFPHLEGVLDLIYNPARTKLLLDAEKMGIPAVNGLKMLVAQAKESAEWFTGNKICNDTIDSIYNCLRKQMENIILIGMPGSGKTAIAPLIAQALGRDHVDADAYLVKKTGRSIGEIYTTEGEVAFRSMETAVLRELGKRSGLVISTGGGCVTRAENYDLLHQNGTLICLRRDLEKLPIDGRPLMKNTTKEALFRAREPLYNRFADHQVDNNTTLDAAAAQILHLLEG